MQNVIDKIEWMFAGLGGFLGWFFGGFDGFLYALVVFVVCDYFTGVLAAAIKHELSSEVGFKASPRRCASSYWSALPTSLTHKSSRMERPSVQPWCFSIWRMRAELP
jgi:hypothetical protein